MPTEFIKVLDEGEDDPIELPLEEDGTLLLSTLKAQFPAATGLKYKAPCGVIFRGVRLDEKKFHPPISEGWGTVTYHLVYPKILKRTFEDQEDTPAAKAKKIESKIVMSDLIVLGLSWRTSEDELKKYFEENVGEVLLSRIKRDPRTGRSKGFGFIKFKNADDQLNAVKRRHKIEDRWCDVRVPHSKDDEAADEEPFKVFVGRCTRDLTVDVLREYFERFGEVMDVFIPQPFRSFAFVSFQDCEVAQAICGQDHIIKDVSVHVSSAARKKTATDKNTSHQQSFSQKPIDENFSQRSGYNNSSWSDTNNSLARYPNQSQGYDYSSYGLAGNNGGSDQYGYGGTRRQY